MINSEKPPNKTFQGGVKDCQSLPGAAAPKAFPRGKVVERQRDRMRDNAPITQSISISTPLFISLISHPLRGCQLPPGEAFAIKNTPELSFRGVKAQISQQRRAAERSDGRA